MIERSIFFPAPMVQALREDRKTQTRTTAGLGRINDDRDAWELVDIFPQDKGRGIFRFEREADPRPPKIAEVHGIHCPYGVGGDRLWTREAWAAGKSADGFKPLELSPRVWKVDNGGLWFPSTETEPSHPISPRGKTRAAIHMPRWASRDTLEIVSAMPERLHAITREDAIAEGIQVLPLQSADDPSAWWQSAPGIHQCRTPQDSYRQLWESINGPGSWEKNPWVWRVEFRRVTGKAGG